MAELETQLATQMPQTQELQNSHLHELPPLTIDGIPTPVDKMTQVRKKNRTTRNCMLILVFFKLNLSTFVKHISSVQ